MKLRLGICFQAIVVLIIRPYYRLAYTCAPGAGLPRPRGSTLVLCNHQNDMDTNVTIIELEWGGPWDRPIYSAASWRMFEPGFLATRLPWLRSWLRTISATKLFTALGLLPIENEIRVRSVARLARWIYARHGEVPVAQAFDADLLAQLPPGAATTTVGRLFGGSWFKMAEDTRVSLKTVREPYRSEMLEQTRQNLMPDFERFECLLKGGDTLFLTPEGHYSRNGRMNPLLGALPRLKPFAESIYLVALSYDVYVGRPFSMLLRIVAPPDPDDLEASMRATRPVTVSQLLATWIVEEGLSSFTFAQADAAVRAALRRLPLGAFVDPKLRADPTRMVREAVQGMRRLGTIVDEASTLRLTSQRQHPLFQLPLVEDMLAYQANFFSETVQALHDLGRAHASDDDKQVQRRVEAQVPPTREERFIMTFASCRAVLCSLLLASVLFIPMASRAGTTGTLSGYVYSTSGAPLQSAQIAATSPSQTAKTTTDETGHFVFVALLPDTYSVSASKDGYQPSLQPGVLVTADTTQTVAFSLEPQVKTLSKIAVSANTAGLLRPGTTQDIYTITSPLQTVLSGLNGGTSLNQAYSAISAVPGAFVPPGQTGWNQPIFLRGGDFNEIGYELDGIPLNRAFDNIPTTNLSTLGQQQLQVYTGGAPADAESHGLAGYINQVIKTGTVPGFADAELGIGSPALYNKASIEGGGATTDRRFTYYFGVSGYNQDFRYIDQFNGAQFSQTFGQPFDLANAAFGPLATLQNPLAGPGCTAFIPNGSDYAGCYANHGYFNSLPVGPGGYIQGPFPNGKNATVADRENVINLHYSIPHERTGINDDIQVLYDVSQLNTDIYSSYADWGGASTWTTAEAQTPGLHAGTVFPTFQTGFQYAGALGMPVAGSIGGPIANMSPYLFPSEDQFGINGQIPINQRDGSSNAQALVKLQYQHDFSAVSYLRVYGYSAYSN